MLLFVTFLKKIYSWVWYVYNKGILQFQTAMPETRIEITNDSNNPPNVLSLASMQLSCEVLKQLSIYGLQYWNGFKYPIPETVLVACVEVFKVLAVIVSMKCGCIFGYYLIWKEICNNSGIHENFQTVKQFCIEKLDILMNWSILK